MRTKIDDKEIFLRELKSTNTQTREKITIPTQQNNSNMERIDARIEEAYEDGFKMEEEIKNSQKKRRVSEKNSNKTNNIFL